MGKAAILVVADRAIGAWALAAGRRTAARRTPIRRRLEAGNTRRFGTSSAKPPGNHVANGDTHFRPPTRRAIAACLTFKPDSYIIGVDDILAINVWKEPELSKNVPVRPDGMITLPLIGEIKAVGLTPVQLQDQITDRAAEGHVRSPGDGDGRGGQQPELQHHGQRV